MIHLHKENILKLVMMMRRRMMMMMMMMMKKMMMMMRKRDWSSFKLQRHIRDNALTSAEAPVVAGASCAEVASHGRTDHQDMESAGALLRTALRAKKTLP